MKTISISLADQTIEIHCPQSLAPDVEFAFRDSLAATSRPHRHIHVKETALDEFSLLEKGHNPVAGLARDDLAVHLMEAVVRGLINDLHSAVVLHAGAVARSGKVALVAGVSGSGKSSMTAWLTAQDFLYLTDEVALLRPTNREILGFPRALVLKQGAAEAAAGFPGFQAAPSPAAGGHTFMRPFATAPRSPLPCGLILFPRFSAGSDLHIEPVGAAEAALRLVGCNLNARNLPDGGFLALSDLARSVPAIGVRYGAFEQLEGIVDVLVGFLLESPLGAPAKRRFVSAFPSAGKAPATSAPAKTYSVPAATPKRAAKKFTIGMATYDDYDGVYFSLQALRLYHQDIAEDVEFLVVDNHPDGVCAAPLKDLENYIPNYRYVPFSAHSGTAVRNVIFEESSADLVLCMDCHVFVVPGALKRLLQYFEADPGTTDLLQGPMLNDDLAGFSTHFDRQWRTGFYGAWGGDDRANDIDGAPFDIPMQGLGLFACARKAWPGFNPLFRGFGGEEGYIHEKFRSRGARTLCLPFLRWVHRFQRPLGVPYRINWGDRIRNYVIGFSELGLPVAEVEAHFREYLGVEVADGLLRPALQEAAALYDLTSLSFGASNSAPS